MIYTCIISYRNPIPFPVNLSRQPQPSAQPASQPSRQPSQPASLAASPANPASPAQPTQPAALLPAARLSSGGEWFLMLLLGVFKGVSGGFRIFF